MQPQAWYFSTPRGLTYGPCYTRWQAQVEAARRATKRPKLEAETAAIIWRSLPKMGWKVGHTHTKLIPPPSHDLVVYGDRSIMARWADAEPSAGRCELPSDAPDEALADEPLHLAPGWAQGVVYGYDPERERATRKRERRFLAVIFTCWGAVRVLSDYSNDQLPDSFGIIVLIGLFQAGKWLRSRLAITRRDP